MSELVPVIVIEDVEAFVILTAAAAVVSVPVQTKEVVEVQAVMLLTVAVPLESVVVPHTMRGDAWAVLEHVVVVPQVLTFCGTFELDDICAPPPQDNPEAFKYA